MLTKLNTLSEAFTALTVIGMTLTLAVPARKAPTVDTPMTQSNCEPIVELIVGPDPQKGSPLDPRFHLTPDPHAICYWFNKLPEDTRRTILEEAPGIGARPNHYVVYLYMQQFTPSYLNVTPNRQPAAPSR